MAKAFLRNSLIILLLFLSAGAFYGGILMLLDTSGALLGLPLYLLNYSPFKTYLFPGLFLVIFLGLTPLITALALIMRTGKGNR